MSDKTITIFGSSGFIGSHLLSFAKTLGYSVLTPRWQDGVPGGDLGTIIYCCGVGDCNRPIDVIHSHVGFLSEVLQKATYQKVVYISSTRLYINSLSTSEDADLLLSEKDSRKLFNLAKLTGEDICKKLTENSLIIRPSNVYGLATNSTLFLPSLVRDAILKQEINLFVARDYAKDYLLVDDLSKACFDLIEKGISGTYNVGSGQNVTSELIVDMLVKETGCKANWSSKIFNENFSPIDVSKIKSVLVDYSPRLLVSELETMIAKFKKFYS